MRRLIRQLILIVFIVLVLCPSAGSEPVGDVALHEAYLPVVARPIPGFDAQVTFDFSEVLQPWDARHIAVGFHKLQFIDAQARVLGEITFGTAQANALQGSGWFENQTWPDIGSFQWAGSEAKRATMQIHVPGNTEGLLLDIRSVKEGLWMDVTVGARPAYRLRVDDYWHSGYVPVGPAVVEAEQAFEPVWTVGRYFPAFPATDRLYSIRMRAPLPDWTHNAIRESWRINQSHQVMMDLTLVGMQGLINRTMPRVYFDWYEPMHVGTLEDTSGFWQPALAKHVQLVEMELDGLSAAHFLWRRFGPRFKGAVIYDPLAPDTINLATMLAGLEDRVMLAPEQLTLPGIDGWLQEMEARYASSMNPLSLPTHATYNCATDLRALAQQQGWQATVAGQTAIYQWVYDNLWPNLEKRIIGLISPGPPTSREMQDDIYWVMGLASRDYMVALKLPAIYLHPEEDPQASLLGRFLDDAPSPIPVTGVFSGWEEQTTEVATRHGDWIAGISWPGAVLRVRSLSALGGVRPPVKRYPVTFDEQRMWDALGDGPVATVFSTDGDAIFWHMGRGSHGEFAWELVQGQVFGWTHNPVISELAPVVWNDFIETRDEVSLLCGTAGVGYMYPLYMTEQQMSRYLDYAGRYLDDTGLRSLFIYTVRGSWEAETARRYYTGLEGHGYLGAILGGNQKTNDNLVYHAHPAPAVWHSYGMTPGNMAQTADDLLARYHGEIDLDLDTHHHEGQNVADPDALGGTAAWFSRSNLPDCCHVVGGPMNGAYLGPGSYTATFRLKVPDNSESEDVARVTVRSPSAGVLAQQTLAPVDFAQGGRYEDIKLTFTLDRFATGVQVEMDYYGGRPGDADVDLYADYVHLIPQGSPAMPVFAAVQLMWGEGMLNLPRDFAARLEAGGGVVLHPDEFLASLNPEFMIEWARPILGDGHAALDEASDHLDAGRYLDSLYVIREALKASRQ